MNRMYLVRHPKTDRVLGVVRARSRRDARQLLVFNLANTIEGRKLLENSTDTDLVLQELGLMSDVILVPEEVAKCNQLQ